MAYDTAVPYPLSTKHWNIPSSLSSGALNTSVPWLGSWTTRSSLPLGLKSMPLRFHLYLSGLEKNKE